LIYLTTGAILTEADIEDLKKKGLIAANVTDENPRTTISMSLCCRIHEVPDELPITKDPSLGPPGSSGRNSEVSWLRAGIDHGVGAA
jgi:hypothetical protein